MGHDPRRGLIGGGLGAAVLAIAALVLLTAGPAGADGTEMLGPPSIQIADGDTFVGNGVGLVGTEPGGADPGGSRPLTLDVPPNATVEQVLVYWEGQSTTPGAGDDTLLVNGTEVTGQVIGGPTAIGQVFTQTYRADITSLGVVVPGVNTIELGGLAFDDKNSGAGIMAILDTAQAATVEMVDGNDFAFFRFDPPLDTTTPITVNFPTTSQDTTGTPLMFISSVDDERPRSSIIRFTFDTGDVVEFDNVLQNNNGNEWDTFTEPVPVPAGASSATVQVLSELPPNDPNAPLQASLVWNLAAISIPQQAQLGGLEVVKTLSGATEGHVPGTTFVVDVDCDGTQFDTALELNPGGDPGSVSGIPPGTSCTVTETGIPDPADGFSYGPPTYTPGQTVVIDDSEIVQITVDNPLSESSIALTASAQCIDDTPYIDYEAVLDGIDAPDGATIRFIDPENGELRQELAGQPLAGRLLWPGAVVNDSGETIDWPGWQFIDGEWVEVDDGQRPQIDMEIEVNPTDTVRLDYPPPFPNCNPNPTGSLQVRKVVLDDGAGHVEGTTFDFALQCSDPAFDQVFSLTDGEVFTTERLTVGTSCTVIETALPEPESGWSWSEPTYSPAQTVVVPETAELIEVVVSNSATQRDTPLVPDKPAIPSTGAESRPTGLLGLSLLTLGAALLVVAHLVDRRRAAHRGGR